MIEVSKYDKSHEEKLISLLKKEKDWDSFTNESVLDIFKNSLLNSVSMVSCFDGTVCGYIRAIDDAFGVYISELYVGPCFRNRGCGLALLNSVKHEFSRRHVYVFSDEDKYYEKHGFTRVGSVFEI